MSLEMSLATRASLDLLNNGIIYKYLNERENPKIK